jgi:hypothetical protein
LNRVGKLWLLSIMAGASAAFAEASWKLYDLRDLLAALPARSDGPEARTDGENVEEMLDRVCDAFAIGCTPLTPGIYGIEAQDADHARLQLLLQGLRDLYQDRYAVQFFVYRSPVERAPRIGDEAPAIKPVQCHQFVTSRRTPTRLHILAQSAFVSGVTPVVAQSVSAFEPKTTAIHDGLDLSVLVGANGNDEEGTTLGIVGEMKRVTWPKQAVDDSPFGPAEVRLRFPLIDVRTIQSNLHVKFDKAVVVSVSAGYDEGECFILAASIRKL